VNAVEITGLSKILKGHAVLNNINISLERGKIHGFFGRNGSGKTMLFRAICGLIKPTSGSIYVYGKKLGKEISFPESLGVIIDSVGFWPHYTGFRNLKFLAAIKNIISDDDIRNAIRRVGLDPDDKRAYKKYSMGMKQRLGIAQAIMEKPNLIILDEPTNALDEEGITLIRNILKEEKERGATILIASHNKEDIELLADYKYKVEQGRVITLTKECDKE